MKEKRKYVLEQVGPIQIVQLYMDGFEKLSLKEKLLAYWLSKAAVAGRDIAFDQTHKYALEVRDLFEEIITHSEGIDSRVLEKITKYLKLLWLHNGMYDSDTSRKFVPEITFDQFLKAVRIARDNGARLKSKEEETLPAKIYRLKPHIFDPTVDLICTERRPGKDPVADSANNYYEGVTFKEMDGWAKKRKEKNPLNSKVIKENGKIKELIWRAGDKNLKPGMYTKYLKKIIFCLKQALSYACSKTQEKTIKLLIRYFRTGDPKDFRKFNIHWIKDDSKVDFILGFIEVYMDARAQKGEYQGIVFFTDQKRTEPLRRLASNVQYFEDKAPWKDKYKNPTVNPPLSKVVNIITETGLAGPISYQGFNLPNEKDIRQRYGSKAIILQNIVDIQHELIGKRLTKEFCYPEDISLYKQYGREIGNLDMAIHEVIGHPSGKAVVKGDPSSYLPGYYSTLEEARAYLVPMWYCLDKKLIEISLLPNQEAGKLICQDVIRMSFTNLRRVPKGDKIQSDHMKAVQLIFSWLLGNSEAIKVKVQNGKTYFKITDYRKLKKAVGEPLSEVMRIIAEGDLKGAKKLVDKYGVKINTKLRDEVTKRAKAVNLLYHLAYVIPKLELVKDEKGKVTDVKVIYPLDFTKQMLEYSGKINGGEDGKK